MAPIRGRLFLKLVDTMDWVKGPAEAPRDGHWAVRVQHVDPMVSFNEGVIDMIFLVTFDARQLGRSPPLDSFFLGSEQGV